MRLPVLLMALAIGMAACNRPAAEPIQSPVPTRQTTIDPVTKKLDAATKDIERRRQELDDAAK